jgi:N-acetylglucosamine repressor
MRKASPFDILRLVYTLGPLSRADLAEMTTVAPSHISVLIRQALNQGLLIERGSAPSKNGLPVTPGSPAANSGRRRVLLEANPNFAKLIGIDIGRTHIRIVVTDFRGKTLAHKWLPTEASRGREQLLQAVHEEIESQRAQFPGIAAIGVSHSGVIDPQAGKVLFWPMIEGWDNTPLRQLFEDAHVLPTFLVGDSVRAMSVTEERFGHGKGLRNFLLVSVGMGIGCAMFLDGHLYTGHDGLAGELGHTTVQEDGEACSCGNRGCLELCSSASAIVRRARSELDRGVASHLTQALDGNLDQLSVEVIAAAAQSHDRLSERILWEAGAHLGTAVASMVNLLNPQKVILAGKVSQAAGEILLGPFLYNLRQRALPQIVKNLTVVVSEFGEEAPAVGMALVAGEGVLKARCRELETV